MNKPPNRIRCLALMINDATDVLSGAILLLTGFQLLPLDATLYGVENWITILLGAVMFLLGAGVFAYHLSRLEE